MIMTTANIEELSAKITGKAASKFIWYFGFLLLAIAGLYYGIQIKFEQLQRQMDVNHERNEGQMNLLKDQISGVKADVSDVKDDVKDLKGTIYQTHANHVKR